MIYQQMPTFLLFHKGEKVGDAVGARPDILQVNLYYPLAKILQLLMMNSSTGTRR